MKWLVLIVFIVFQSSTLLAQQRLNKVLIGKVTFDQDSTGWIATVIEKDTVSVLFRVQFELVPTQILPQNGTYQIVYGPRSIVFNNTKKRKSYAFALDDDIAPTPVKKGFQQWQVVGISRMNPVCFPTKN